MKLFKAVNSYCKLQVESDVEIVRKGILIVDDSKFSRNMLKDILKAEGFLIVGEAGDGIEAIDMARERKPEFIFMDVEMPKLDGLGAIPRILEFDPKIKIVMCTALGQKNIILEAAKAGAKDYILKPYIKENIMGVLNEITEKNQKEGQVIPFKPGKNHLDGINNIIIDEKLRKPPTDTVEWNSEIDFKLEEDSITDKNPDSYIEKEEFLQPLEYEEENEVDEGLDSLIDCVSLQDNTREEVLESYLNEELPDKGQPQAEAVPEEVIVNVEIPEDDETEDRAKFVVAVLNSEIPEDDTTVAEAELEEDILNKETLEDDATVAEAKPEEAILNKETLEDDTTVAETEAQGTIVNKETSVDDATVVEVETEKAILNEETSEDNATVVEAEPEMVIVNEEVSEKGNSLEKTDPDIPSESNSYTYLWNNRFDILQKEFNIQNTLSRRLSFYEYAYLETDKYDIFGKDYLKREISLGLMNAYMSLDNRLQQNDSPALGFRALIYPKETRLSANSILEESNNKFTEITIVNEIKYNNLKPKQISQEIVIKTSFYQFVSDFVNGKSRRVLR